MDNKSVLAPPISVNIIIYDGKIKPSLPNELLFHFVAGEVATAVSAISVITFIIISLLLVLYYRGRDENISGTGSPHNLVLLFFAFVISSITTMSEPKYNNNTYHVYNTVILLFVGILVTILGSHLFFRAPREDERPLCCHHPNISLIIWVITIPLIIMEVFEFIGAVTVNLNVYTAVFKLTTLLQKLVQASVYHFSLRYKVPHDDRKQGATWYLRIISLFNFVMWLDSMVTRSDENIEKMFGSGFAIISTALVALLIDYRLLCCMMFAEHSNDVYEVTEYCSREEKERASTILVDNETEFRIMSSQMRGLGFIFGIVIIALQLVCGVQSFRYVGVWVNIFPILAEISVVVLGFLLLRQAGVAHVTLSGKWRKTDAKGIDIMVAIMGITGFLFWMIMSILNGCWIYSGHEFEPRTLSYLKWSCGKNVVRSCGIILQLCIFVKCGPFFGCRENVKGKKMTYFLLPALMLSFLSIFVMAIMDGHSKVVEEFTEKSGLGVTLIFLLRASEPLYLGYCLHLFLHFFIVYNNLRFLKPATRIPNNGMELKPLVSNEQVIKEIET